MRLVARATAALAGCALAVSALAACAGGKSASAKDINAVGDSHQILTRQLAAQVFSTYIANEDVARAANDEYLALSWVTAGQTGLTVSQFRRAAFDGVPVARYRYGTPTFYVPRLGDKVQWFLVEVPRTTEQTGIAPVTQTAMMVFFRPGPSDGWRLSLETMLMKGTQPPSIALDADGYATPLATFDPSLLIPPREVVSIQSTIAQEGPPGSLASRLMDSGPYTTDLNQQLGQKKNYYAQRGFAYDEEFNATEFPVFALRTTDGAGYVLYSMAVKGVMIRKQTSNPLPIPQEMAHLLQSVVVPNQLNFVLTYQFGAYDPLAATATAAPPSTPATTASGKPGGSAKPGATPTATGGQVVTRAYIDAADELPTQASGY